MYEQINKPKENKSRSVANSVTQNKSNGKQGFGFVDNRLAVVSQRNAQTNISDSSSQSIQKRESNTGLPDNLKSDINNRPGYSVDVDINGEQAIQKQSFKLSQISVSNRTTPDGLVVQCVGGPKFGLENTGDAAHANVIAGIPLLQAAQVAYKAATKATKDAAIATFNGGDTSNHGRQGTYTAALQTAEMTPEGLVAQAGAGFALAAGVITYHGTEIARVHLGHLAYVQHAPALGAGLSPVYKRHTLAGLSNKEYVNMGGDYLRRTAHRGITPPERTAFKTGNDLTPINAGNEAIGQTGFSFNTSTGVPIARGALANSGATNNDLTWLNERTNSHFGAIPNDPKLLAFMQTRKGVGKSLSATSTDKAITSNHGAAFTEFGNIDIDLARVPTASVTHHYKQPSFNPATLDATLGGLGHGGLANLTTETTRANESVTRNREILFSSIPSAAVTLHDTPARLDYELEFRKLFTPDFNTGYLAALANSTVNFGLVVPPAPTSYPYREDHFTQLQARTDYQKGIGTTAGRNAALPRVAFGEAFVAEYKRAWIQAYDDNTYNSPYFASLSKDELHDFDPVVPGAPNPAVIPPGVTAKAGALAGTVPGTAAGAAAGLAYTG